MAREKPAAAVNEKRIRRFCNPRRRDASGPRSVCVIRGVATWTALFGTTRSDASV